VLLARATTGQGADIRVSMFDVMGLSEPQVEMHEALITLTRQGWAQDNPAVRHVLMSLLLPDATLEEMALLNEQQGISASAENVGQLLQRSGISISSICCRALPRRLSCCTAVVMLPCHSSKAG